MSELCLSMSFTLQNYVPELMQRFLEVRITELLGSIVGYLANGYKQDI